MDRAKLLALQVGLCAISVVFAGGDPPPTFDEASSSQGTVPGPGPEITKILNDIKTLEAQLYGRDPTDFAAPTSDEDATNEKTSKKLNELVEKYTLVELDVDVVDAKRKAELLRDATKTNFHRCNQASFLMHHSLSVEYADKPSISSYLQAYRPVLIEACSSRLHVRIASIRKLDKHPKLELLIDLLFPQTDGPDEGGIDIYKLENSLARYMVHNSHTSQYNKGRYLSGDLSSTVTSMRLEVEHVFQRECEDLQIAAGNEIAAYRWLIWFAGSDDARVNKIFFFRKVLVKAKLCDMLSVYQPAYNEERVAHEIRMELARQNPPARGPFNLFGSSSSH